jgi:hypothetical protein
MTEKNLTEINRTPADISLMHQLLESKYHEKLATGKQGEGKS